MFKKNDATKLMLQLIIPQYIEQLGSVLTNGALKYGLYNWKKGNNKKDIERIKGAILRHLYAYLRGEKIDKDSGLSHLSHINCNLMFLFYFDIVNNDVTKRH